MIRSNRWPNVTVMRREVKIRSFGVTVKETLSRDACPFYIELLTVSLQQLSLYFSNLDFILYILGFSLKQKTSFLMRQQAEDLLAGKKPDTETARKENTQLVNKYSK